MIKPFEVVAREYMYLRDSDPLNKHIAQIYTTIRYHGCTQKEAVVQEIQEAIAKAKLDIEHYKDTDVHYVRECSEKIHYCEDFLARANEEIPDRYLGREIVV
jgi:hypothetical protein